MMDFGGVIGVNMSGIAGAEAGYVAADVVDGCGDFMGA